MDSLVDNPNGGLARSLSDQNPDYRALKAIDAARLKESQNVFRALQSVAESDRGTKAGTHSYMLIAHIYQQEGNVSKAESAFLPVIANSPSGLVRDEAMSDLIAMYQEKGMSMLETHDVSAASAMWRKAYDVDTNDVRRSRALCANADTLIARSQLGEARILLHILESDTSKAVMRWREHAECVDAQIYIRTGDCRSALPIVKDLLSSARYHESKQMARGLMAQIKASGE
jgi:tetratricopeptide (TPR) repeat protein